MKARVGRTGGSRAVVVATGVAERRPRGAGHRHWRLRGRRLLDRVPPESCAPGALRRPARDQRPAPGAEGGHRQGFSGRPGSAAGSTSCATCWPRCPGPSPRWSPPPSGRSSPSPTPTTSSARSTRSSRDAGGPVPESPIAGRAAETCTLSPFPQGHWHKIWSTNPLERLNAEIKRRTNVVGIFPNDAAVLRLTTAVVRRVTRRVGGRRTALPVRGVHGPATGVIDLEPAGGRHHEDLMAQ